MKNRLNGLTLMGRWLGLEWRRTFGAGFRRDPDLSAAWRCYPSRAWLQKTQNQSIAYFFSSA
jgi:hypothetical protein